MKRSGRFKARECVTVEDKETGEVREDDVDMREESGNCLESV